MFKELLNQKHKRKTECVNSSRLDQSVPWVHYFQNIALGALTEVLSTG